MTIYKYIILSIIQGITEPLPISSSGHIKILETIFNNSFIQDLDFEIIVNFGSLIAILFLYRKKIYEITIDFFRYIKNKDYKYKTNYDYVIKIIIGTIPVLIFGLFIKDILEKYSNIKIIGISLVITSFFLYIIKDKIGYKDKEKITYLDALKIGFYQVFALIPGISRSGSTITGSLINNLTRETALDYSFMLYIPVSIGSTIIGIKDINISNLLWPYSIYILISSIVTYYSAKLFIDIMKKGKLIYFVIYCLVTGLLVFFLL